MSYIFHILFALATLALVDLGWALEGQLPWAVAALALVPYLLAWATRAVLVVGRFRLGALLERLMNASPVLLQGVAVGCFGWMATLHAWRLGPDTLDDWIGLELLWALLPYLVYQVATIDARARLLIIPPDLPGRLRAFHARMLLAALLPLVVYMAISGFVERSEFWRVCLEEVGVMRTLAAILLVGLFLFWMPFLLRHAWDTEPLPRGWARSLLEKVAHTAGFRFRELLLWRTGQQMSNAAIVGLTPRSRHVFFSDLLLQQLGPRELSAVFAHEMGHARRAHAVVFGAFALGFFLAAQELLELSAIESELVAALVLAGVFACWYLAFGYLSRRFELEADLESLRLVGESGPLVRALELVTGAHAHARSSWRHFSTRDRVAFLTAAEQDPLVGIRLKLRLARWRMVGFLVLGVAGVSEIGDLARAWNEDWIRADLRLGRYEEALERTEDREVDRLLEVLARRGVQAPSGARDAVTLRWKGMEAFRADDRDGAMEWLMLAKERGMPELEPVIAALEDPETPLLELERVWRRALDVSAAR